MERRELSEFELGEPLGVGTVGTVYRASELASGKTLALKLLLPSVSSDPAIRSRFRREMVVLEKLCHPNIVGYYGGGEHEGQLFFAMEFLEGSSLEVLLAEEKRLPWPDVVECGWHVCSALQYAHNQGVIHRDLKPSNLFFSSGGVLKLCDFGIALDTGESDLTNAGLTVGTHRYMAPEMIRGEIATPRTDLYALGCVLYRMLVGRPPFGGRNFAEIFEQHLHETPRSLQAILGRAPEELDDLLMEMLAKDPEDRPVNARAVQGRLAEIHLRWQESEYGEIRWNPVAPAEAQGAGLLRGLASRILPAEPERTIRDASPLRLLGVLLAVAALSIAAWWVS